MEVLQLTDSQEATVEVTGAIDKKGNPASLDGPVAFSSSDETKVTVTVDPSNPNKATLTAVGPLTDSGSTVVVSIDGDGKLGDGVATIHDEIAISIVAGDAVGFAVNLGTPTETA